MKSEFFKISLDLSFVRYVGESSGGMEFLRTPFGNRLQLCSEHGYLLKIDEDGRVSGTCDSLDLYTHLELFAAGDDVGVVKIKGLKSGLYLCFDEKGVLHGKENSEVPGATFKEDFYGSNYTNYESTDYNGWLIGISKVGNAKNGNRTLPGKKATKFLPLRLGN